MKRALIVDDSKTARFKLKKILDIYEITIDLASSAEGALSYLAYQVPDIIFMDHSMKGMNGFDAVKIIKSNSSTATIPVVMYTAEKGDLYLSQARAIGAIDVISKEIMAESDIKRVMRSVNIDLVQRQIDSANDTNSEPSLDLPSASRNHQLTREFARIREQVSQSMRMQQSQITNDIQDSSRLLTQRFMRELRDMQSEFKQNQEQQSELTMLINSQSQRSKTPSFLWALIPLILLLGATIFGAMQVTEIKRDNDRMRDIYKELAVGMSDQNNSVLSQINQIQSNEKERSVIRSDELLSALMWAVNQNGQYEFTSQALGDDRIGLVSGVLNFLDQAQFEGTMTLGIHTGNFCVSTDQSGQLALPASGSVGTDCELLSNYNGDFSSAAQTSTSFLNFLNTSPVVERGKLKVDIQSHGIYSPAQEYPEFSDAVTTSEWNEIAAANNRLIVSLRSE